PTIILTTHYLEEAETLCRNIAIISGGRIVERDRMSSLLRRLHVQTFVLNVREPLAAAPRLEGYVATLVYDHTLEIAVSKEEHLNAIFARLSALGIEVLRLRNKLNRREEIARQLVEGRAQGGAAGRGHGRLRLQAVHRARPDHDVGDHQLLRQRGRLVLRREVRQARGGAAGLPAPQLGDRRRLCERWNGAGPAGGDGGDRRVA